VIVTNNLFGDIITDLAAALHGGLGIACSASLHLSAERVGLFEPVHGSAPDIAGQDKANPLATVLTVGLMLGHLGFPDEEKRLESIVEAAVREKACTADVGGTLGTKATGAFVLDRLSRSLE
jgi:3-isopropylmalate dehydrogenase